MDVAWTAWLQVIGDERRQREMPKAQRSNGKFLIENYQSWNFPLVWSILIDFYINYLHIFLYKLSLYKQSMYILSH